MRITRRRVLTATLVACWAPAALLAQPRGKRTIGIIDDDPAKVDAFKLELRKLGWSTKNSVWEERIGPEKDYPAFAADLVKAKVDVIFAPTTRAVQAAKRATNEIPIVFALAADPVKSGFVTRLNAPEGNITGSTPINAELSGKRLELLKAVLPRIKRVGVLADPSLPYTSAAMAELHAAAKTLHVETDIFQWRDAQHLQSAFQSMQSVSLDAFISLPTPAHWPNRGRMAELALKHGLPGVSPAPEFAQAGVLMAYGQSLLGQYGRAAVYVDRILRGAKPAGLPVEQPTKLDLVINLRTASALGVKVPEGVLIRADEVIR